MCFGSDHDDKWKRKKIEGNEDLDEDAINKKLARTAGRMAKDFQVCDSLCTPWSTDVMPLGQWYQIVRFWQKKEQVNIAVNHSKASPTGNMLVITGPSREHIVHAFWSCVKGIAASRGEAEGDAVANNIYVPRAWHHALGLNEQEEVMEKMKMRAVRDEVHERTKRVFDIQREMQWRIRVLERNTYKLTPTSWYTQPPSMSNHPHILGRVKQHMRTFRKQHPHFGITGACEYRACESYSSLRIKSWTGGTSPNNVGPAVSLLMFGDFLRLHPLCTKKVLMITAGRMELRRSQYTGVRGAYEYLADRARSCCCMCGRVSLCTDNAIRIKHISVWLRSIIKKHTNISSKYVLQICVDGNEQSQ